MGHRKGDSSTYLQYYMSNFIDVDCQSICFGTAPQHDLVQLAARLRRHDGAPKELTVDQLATIHNNKKLVEYREGRRRAVLDWKQQGYRSREEAEGTEMWERYDHYNKEAKKLLNCLKKSLLRKSIEAFYTNAHVEEVERQLRGIKPADIISPPSIQYDLPERARAACLFAKAAELTDRAAVCHLRIELISTVAQLCKRRESPCRRTDKRGRKQAATRHVRNVRAQRSSACGNHEWSDEESVETSTEATEALPRPRCPFCQWQGSHGMSQRTKTWRLSNLARHIRVQHLRRKREAFICPWQGCDAVLANAEHFASHASRHGLDLPPSVFRC